MAEQNPLKKFYSLADGTWTADFSAGDWRLPTLPEWEYAATYRDETLAKIVELTPNAEHLQGYGTTNPTAASVRSWLEEIGDEG